MRGCAVMLLSGIWELARFQKALAVLSRDNQDVSKRTCDEIQLSHI